MGTSTKTLFHCVSFEPPEIDLFWHFGSPLWSSPNVNPQHYLSFKSQTDHWYDPSEFPGREHNSTELQWKISPVFPSLWKVSLALKQQSTPTASHYHLYDWTSFMSDILWTTRFDWTSSTLLSKGHCFFIKFWRLSRYVRKHHVLHG